MHLLVSAILAAALLAACAQTPPPEAAGPARVGDVQTTCAESDLAARSAMPPGTTCVGSEYLMPATGRGPAIRIQHRKFEAPFDKFESPTRKIGASRNNADVAFINALAYDLISDSLENLKSGFISSGFAFYWLGERERLGSDRNVRFPTEFMPQHYSPGSCLHAKYQIKKDIKLGNLTMNDHLLICWVIDFDHRRLRFDDVTFTQMFVPELGESPSPAFDAEAAAFFRSLRPPT